VHLGSLFTGNKPSRVVHLECELHNLVQGDMLAHDYSHQLQQLANSLVDCDAPIFDHALVHQLIRGLNPKFSVLKTLLPCFLGLQPSSKLVISSSMMKHPRMWSPTVVLRQHYSPPVLRRQRRTPHHLPNPHLMASPTTMPITTSMLVVVVMGAMVVAGVVVVAVMEAAMVDAVVAAAMPTTTMPHSGHLLLRGRPPGVCLGVRHGPV
jgi:hypothetical protein